MKRSPAWAPLLERLTDLDPSTEGEPRPFRTLAWEELKESVRRNLQWLLNTRTSAPAHGTGGEELTVLDYGIPDFGSSSPEDPDHRLFLARGIARAISAFEPRLTGARVIVEPEMPNEKTLRVRVDAELVVGAVTEPVSFETHHRRGTGILELHERAK